MRRTLVLLLALTGLALAILARRPTPRVPDSPAARPAETGHRAVQGGGIDMDSVRAVRAVIRRRIAEASTYLPAMLASGDSILKRWPDRSADPVRVYLPEGTVDGYTAEHRQAVREALTRWQRASAIPVVFQLVRDSAQADVRVVWIDRFEIQRTGQADVVWNALGWLVRGTLTLATHSPEGVRLSPEETYTVALHEIGHLLGLGHSDNPADLMYPSTTIHDLTVRDKRTLSLLYALPPGSVRDPG